MINLKTDKRIKYNSPYTIYAALDPEYWYDFRFVTRLENELTKKEYLAFEFYKGYKPVNLTELRIIKNILIRTYPKSEYKVICRYPTNAPELKEFLLIALCK